MTTHRFCDFCGKEIPNAEPHQGKVSGETALRTTHGRPYFVEVTVAVTFKSGQTGLDVCQRCVFDAARRVDPGPVEEPREP